MIITPFDAADELIIVPATIWNPRGAYRELLMAVDTGSTETLVMPHITDELGYGAHLGEQITVIRSVVGREQGYLMPVARFSALGFDMPDFRMHIHDLPDGYGIEGIPV